MSGTPSEDHGCTQERFDRLLAWLHADRDEAAAEYNRISFKLLVFFQRRLARDGHSCADAESLVDDSMMRVCGKMPQLADDYVGKPILYFFVVARNIYFEYLERIKKFLSLSGQDVPAPDPDRGQEKEIRDRCLRKCLERFAQNDHKLLLGYFQDDKKAKIDHRKALSEELQISLNTLRMRIYRLKEELGECVRACVERALEQQG